MGLIFSVLANVLMMKRLTFKRGMMCQSAENF